jgi:hypothetical protein
MVQFNRLNIISPWLITLTSERSLFGITIGAVLNKDLSDERNPICSTMPCISPIKHNFVFESAPGSQNSYLTKTLSFEFRAHKSSHCLATFKSMTS